MKKIVPNQLINQSANKLLSGKSLNVMMKRVLILLMLALFTANVTAQAARAVHPAAILEVEAFLANLRSADASSRTGNGSAAHVESLINDIQPAVYFSASGIRTYGDKPNSLYTDPASLIRITGAAIPKNDIEIITVRINSLAELNSVIDLSVFSDYPKLKYVYILSSVKTTGDAITRSVKNASANYAVFYKISIGS